MPSTPKPLAELEFQREISARDWMSKNLSPDLYFLRGYEALQFAVAEVGKLGFVPETILDFGCGHGNVARMFVAHFQNSAIFGQDVDPDWLEWCETNLGIRTMHSPPAIAEVEIAPDTYDLIWVGSVFTHIPEKNFDHLLDRLLGGLTPRGVLIFTTAGEGVSRTFDVSGEFALTRDVAEVALADYHDTGYGFAPYTGGRYPDWGRALVSFDRVYRKLREHPASRLFAFSERGWGRRQDVYTVVRP